MRFQIHLQKLQQRLAFAHGDGQVQSADVLGTIFELQANGHFVGRHGVRKQARALIVEQTRDQKQQRLQQADGMIQLDAIFIRGFRLEDFERPMDGAASQLLQVNTVRPEAFGEAVFGQLGQLIERVDAPAFEDLRHLFGERERRDIQIVEIGRALVNRVTPGKLRAAMMAASAVSAMAMLIPSPACFGRWLRRSVAANRGGAVSHRRGRRRCRARSARTMARMPRRFEGGALEGREGKRTSSERLALNCAVTGRTGLRDAASSSTSRRSEKPGAPVQMVFLRSISSISDAQDLAMGSFSASARMVGVFSMARRNRYQ